MKSELTHSIVKNSLILASFAVVVGLTLALIYNSSEEQIEAQKLAAQRQTLATLMPTSKHDNDLITDSISLDPEANNFDKIELLGLRENSNFYIARQNHLISGFIFPVIARDGYNGDIELLLGINIDGSISGVRVVQHRETPGLGDKIDLRLSDWILAFNEKSLSNTKTPTWQVKKSGGEFDQFVGATITPRAVVIAVNLALQFYELNKGKLLSL